MVKKKKASPAPAGSKESKESKAMEDMEDLLGDGPEDQLSVSKKLGSLFGCEEYDP
jgi:hypothetical protein